MVVVNPEKEVALIIGPPGLIEMLVDPDVVGNVVALIIGPPGLYETLDVVGNEVALIIGPPGLIEREDEEARELGNSASGSGNLSV